jgi:hypothetical protein
MGDAVELPTLKDDGRGISLHSGICVTNHVIDRLGIDVAVKLSLPSVVAPTTEIEVSENHEGLCTVTW